MPDRPTLFRSPVMVRHLPLSIVLLVVGAYAVTAALAAQTPGDPDWQAAAGGKMAFEVASVKLAKLPRLTPWSRLLLNSGNAKPPGGLISVSAPLSSYIFFAYKLEIFQGGEILAKLPKWTNDLYEIDAKAEGNPTKDQMRLMMQSLLADRFKLKVHFETKEGPVLALTLVKPGKLGPKLLPHSEGPPCPDSFETTNPLEPDPPPKPGVAWPPQCGSSAQMGTLDGTWLGSRNTTMGLLANAIYGLGVTLGELDQPVVDQTGLEGRFDFMLELPPGIISLGPRPRNRNPSNPDDPLSESKDILLPNALRKQLGLKLVRSRGDVRAMIIDHIEPPSQN